MSVARPSIPSPDPTPPFPPHHQTHYHTKQLAALTENREASMVLLRELEAKTREIQEVQAKQQAIEEVRGSVGGGD